MQEIVNSPDPRKTGVVTRQRLEEKALSLIAASADTVGNALTMATYQPLPNPDAHRRLLAELQEAIPDVKVLQTSNPKYDAIANVPRLVSSTKNSV